MNCKSAFAQRPAHCCIVNRWIGVLARAGNVFAANRPERYAEVGLIRAP